MEDNMNHKDKETNSPAEVPHTPPPSQPTPNHNGQDMHLPLRESTVAANRAKALIVLVIIVLVAVGATYLITKSTTKTTTPPKNSPVALAPARVNITSKGFSPATVTVKVNQAVVWTNKDSANHEVNSDAYPKDDELPSFNDTQPIPTDSTYAYVFNQAGTYSYHDDLNPFTFKGTVVVKK